MKRIYKWLVPGFLKRVDTYLLEGYPVLWRTGIHFVLFYGFTGGLVLFGAGFLYPVHQDGEEWVVDPIRPIELPYDWLYLIPLVLVVVFIVIWNYRQFRMGLHFYHLRDTLFTLLIYVLGLWFLIGVTASTFRLGTIVHVAYCWVAPVHLGAFKKSSIYPYGFVLLKQDSIRQITSDTLAFFQKREEKFKAIWKEENKLLKSRYNRDTSFWTAFLERKEERLSYRSFLSFLSCRSHQPNMPNQSYQLYRLFRSNLLDISELPNLSHMSMGSYRSNLRYLSIYTKISKQEKFKSLEHIASRYGIKNHQVAYGGYGHVFIPSLTIQIEDMVRSVNHARQYLEKGIFWRHFFFFPHYALYIGLPLFLAPFLSFRHIFWLSILVILASFSGVFSYSENIIIYIFCLFLMPCIGLITIVLFQKLYISFHFFANLVFLGVLLTMLTALSIILDDYTSKLFGWPINVASYGTQLIGLLAACLIPYAQAMPKKG